MPTVQVPGPFRVDVGAGQAAIGASMNAAGLYQWNGSGWDPERSNFAGTLLASAARTATVNSADQLSYNWRGLMLYIDVTAVTLTPLVTPSVQAKDPVTGGYKDFILFTQLAPTGAGAYVLTCYPGVVEASVLTGNGGNESKSRTLPRTFRLAFTHADADSITYSVGLFLCV